VNAVSDGLSLPRWQRGAIVALGAGDLATGVLLVLSPATVESLLGLAPSPPAASVFLRWVGLFVAAVGAAYLAPFRIAAAASRRERLRFALAWTAWTRLAVAAFVGAAVLAAALPDGWCLVGSYDALAASGQLALLASWARRDGD